MRVSLIPGLSPLNCASSSSESSPPPHHVGDADLSLGGLGGLDYLLDDLGDLFLHLDLYHDGLFDYFFDLDSLFDDLFDDFGLARGKHGASGRHTRNPQQLAAR